VLFRKTSELLLEFLLSLLCKTQFFCFLVKLCLELTILLIVTLLRSS